ncbi:MAG: DUF1571 domain-containing protein [Phycisphaerae bacterium]
MLSKSRFRLTNRRVRLAVGLLLAGLFSVQCTQTSAWKDSDVVTPVNGVALGENSPETVRKIDELARTDHIALLEWCLENACGRYRDYTCTFVKQERIGGRLRDAQQIDVKFLAAPFSVAMLWTENPPIADRLIYVENKYNGKMLVRPTGILGGLVGTVTRDPTGEDVRRNTLRPVTLFGFVNALENLLDVYRQADQAGDLKTEFGGYAEVGGREVVKLVRYLPPKDDYPAHKTEVYIDLEYLVPICIEGRNWDDELSSRYVYKDIRFNVGLTEDDFRPETLGMEPPK